MTSVSASSSTTSTVSFSFSSDASKSLFIQLGNETVAFKVNNTDYVFGKTISGFAIQPRSDFVNFRLTGFYVSRDFTTMISDGTENTDAAVMKIMTIVAARITSTVTSTTTLKISSST